MAVISVVAELLVLDMAIQLLAADTTIKRLSKIPSFASFSADFRRRI